MDPLSISASIAGLLALAGIVTRYLSTIPDALDQQERLLLEVTSASGMLQSLWSICEHADSNSGVFMSLKSLNTPEGPFDQFKMTLELLANKLAPAHRSKKIKRALTWYFDRDEINALMDVIQRQRSYYTLALQGNHMQKIALSISSIGADIKKLERGIEGLRTEQTKQVLNQRVRHDSEVLSWLSPLTFTARLENVLDTVHQGTGAWFLKHDKFLNWLQPSADTQILWLPGIPGSGKTCLAGVIIDTLQSRFSSSSNAIMYIFCDYKDHSQTAEQLKRVILRQLLQQLDQVPLEVEQLYESHARKSTEPSSAQIHDLLLNISSLFFRKFLVIDALDEVDGIDGASEALLKLGKMLGARTLITSRETGSLRSHILQATAVNISAQDEDVTAYVQHELQARKRLRLFVQKEPGFASEVIRTILTHCGGMFLVARLHVESLASKLNLRAAKIALKQLPTGLDGVYDDAICRLQLQTQDDVALALRILGWVVLARSPLTITELQHALAVELGLDHFDEDAIIDVDLILSVCVGLVVLNGTSSTIRLVHFTAQEYLQKNASTFMPGFHSEIAQVCIQYLSLEETTSIPLTDKALTAKLESFPFLNYAAENWGIHAAKCDQGDGALQSLIDSFLSKRCCVTSAVHIMLLPKTRYEGDSGDLRQDVRPLHLAAHFGLPETVEMLLKMESIECNDNAGRRPLHWAARKGHVDTVKLLLAHGAKVDARDNVNATSLHLACRNGHDVVAAFLIEQGSDVNAANDVGGTALIWAAIAGSEKTALLLLKTGADVQRATERGSTALHKAVEANSEGIVNLLIRYGADVNALEGQRRRHPLYTAIKTSNESIMRILLEAKAKPDIMTPSVCYSTLAAAIKRPTTGPLHLLLQYGADPDRRYGNGETPLHYAARYGGLEAVSTLLPFASLAAVDDQHRTVLAHAINTKNENDGAELVRLLLNTQHVDLDARDVDGCTALMRSREFGLKKTTQLLLDAGAKES